MKHLFKQPFFYTSIASLIALGLIISSYVFGWVTPTAAPPGGNITLSSGALPSGSPGYVQFASSSTAFGGDAGLFWDNTNKRLGIGTTTPGAKLDVQAPDATHGLYVNTATTSASYYGLDVRSGGTSRLYVRADGNVGIGTTNPQYQFQVGNGTTLSDFALNSSADSWFYQLMGGAIKSYFGFRSGTDKFTIGTYSGGYADRLVVDRTTGNVGIGTTAPSEKLTVIGNIKLGGATLQVKEEGYCKTTSTYTGGSFGGVSGANTICASECGSGYVFASSVAPLEGISSNVYIAFATTTAWQAGNTAVIGVVHFTNCTGNVNGWSNTNASYNCNNWTDSTTAYRGSSDADGTAGCMAQGIVYCNVASPLICYKLY